MFNNCINYKLGFRLLILEITKYNNLLKYQIPKLESLKYRLLRYYSLFKFKASLNEQILFALILRSYKFFSSSKYFFIYSILFAANHNYFKLIAPFRFSKFFLNKNKQIFNCCIFKRLLN